MEQLRSEEAPGAPQRKSLLLTFAGDIGAAIIAEGIETPEELDTLRSLGITWGQGYHLARPGVLPMPSPSLAIRPSRAAPSVPDSPNLKVERIGSILIRAAATSRSVRYKPLDQSPVGRCPAPAQGATTTSSASPSRSPTPGLDATAAIARAGQLRSGVRSASQA